MYVQKGCDVVQYTLGIIFNLFPSNPKKKWSNSGLLYVRMGRDFVWQSPRIVLNIFPSNPSQKWCNSHLLYAQMGQIGTLVRRIVPWDSRAHFRDCHVGYISVQFRPNWSIGRDFVQDSSMSILDIFLSDPHQKWSNGRLLYVGLCHRIVKHTS